MTFAFSESPGISDPRHIERCQDRAQIMLRDHVAIHRADQPARFGKLLLLLPEIRRVSPRTFEEVLFRQAMGHMSFEALLADIFKSP